MHECPICGQACDCDGEDLWFEDAPPDCACPCWQDDFDEDDFFPELDDFDFGDS